MYETFFGLVNRPFLAAPTLDRYYPASTVEQTFQTAARAISRGEGPVAVFGGTGLGKTMFCLRIAEHFRRAFDVVMLASSQLITRRALLQSLLFELQLPYRNLNEGELRLTLMNRLQPTPSDSNQGLLLVVDEAQTLSPKLLDEIRLLTNVTRDGMPRVRLILCGTMKLDDSLCQPQMESLNQRLSCRCYLTPLTPQETAQYVAHKIELCGASAHSVMTRESLDAIYRGTDGIPRLIDQLADQTLLLAAQERQRPISAALVGKAWGMLQQLPNPWSEPESIRSSPKTQSAIESSASLPTSAHSPTLTTCPTPSSISSSIPTATTTSMPEIVACPASEPNRLRTIPTESIKIIPSLIERLSLRDDHDIIEFGTLEDSDQTDTSSLIEESECERAPISNAEATSLNLPSGFEPSQKALESVKPTGYGPEKPSSKNLLDVFGSDFDEEFSLPVQSSPAYQTYSGVSFGNLRDEVPGLNREMTRKYELPEADEFFEAPKPVFDQPSEMAISTQLNERYELQSQFVPSQPTMLERQIEEEMREIVSDINLNAMMFDPMRTIAEDPTVPSNSRPVASEFISFSAISEDWQELQQSRSPAQSRNERSMFSPPDAAKPRPSLGDDRDLLVVEEDVESIRTTMHAETAAPHRPILHPYAKLFSNLRTP